MGTKVEVSDVERVTLVMQHHLPVTFPDGDVLCLCCDEEGAPGDPQTFDGPVFHRRHVATLILKELAMPLQ